MVKVSRFSGSGVGIVSGSIRVVSGSIKIVSGSIGWVSGSGSGVVSGWALASSSGVWVSRF